MVVPQPLVTGLTAWALLSAVHVLAAPTPESVASDVYILLHNHLLGAPTAGDAALVLANLQTHDDAVLSCAALGEGLWDPPPTKNASSTIALSYLAYAADPSAQNSDYWVQKAAAGSCRAITHHGDVYDADCTNKLAVLCSNSAALADANTTDTSSQWQTRVKTGESTLTGYRDKHSFRFLGIRYAAQPERFTHSTLYSGPTNASALDFSPLCVQPGCTATTCSEDCLFLNIWTPYLPKDGPSRSTNLKPVLFWIHGGGFTGGLGSDPTTDGGNMASRGDVVVVTFNYRLSTLGFLALGNNQTNGNYGLGDQVTALDWVRQNIAAFGGDAEKITIMGQSAGGASVRALIASPRAKAKFRSAVPMSGPLGSYPFQSYGNYYTVQESASLFGQAVLTDTNCTGATDVLKCLRSYDPYELVALPDVASSLVVDGVYLTTPSLNVTAPSGPSIPLLTGFMHDDAASFVPWPSANSTLSSILTSYGIPPLPAILSAFPTNSSSNTTLAVFNATSRLATDAGFRCLNLASVLTGARHRVFDPSSTFIYELDRSYMPPSYNPNPLACDAPVTSTHPNGDPTAAYYKCHGGELLFVFGNIVFNQLPFRDDKDVVFSRYVLDRFASFIRTGDVEPAKAFLEARGFVDEEGETNVNFTWQKLDLQNPSFARLDWPPASRPFDEKVQCESFGVGLDYYENGGV